MAAVVSANLRLEEGKRGALNISTLRTELGILDLGYGYECGYGYGAYPSAI
jgi:hypothetical protein